MVIPDVFPLDSVVISMWREHGNEVSYILTKNNNPIDKSELTKEEIKYIYFGLVEILGDFMPIVKGDDE